MMNRRLMLLVLILTFILCLALVPSNAQTSIEGTWLENGIAGTTIVVLGRYGNYLIWRSFIPTIETGTYILENDYLVLTQYKSTATWWKYSQAADRLFVYNEPTGISFNLTRTTFPVPVNLLGVWEGEDDYGIYEYTFYDNGEFNLFYYDDFVWYDGIFLANDEGIAMSYDDGYGIQLTFDITDGEFARQMDFYNALSGEFDSRQWQYVLTPEPAQTSTEAPSLAGIAPTPAIQTEAPIPDWSNSATPAPATEAPVPDWLSSVTPAIQKEGPVPDWLIEATTKPEMVDPTTDLPNDATSEPVIPVTGEILDNSVHELIGKWTGKDAFGTRILTFIEDGIIEINYLEPEMAAMAKNGTYTADNNTITINYPDGGNDVFRYILMGVNLLISDANLTNPLTFTRTADTD